MRCLTIHLHRFSISTLSNNATIVTKGMAMNNKKEFYKCIVCGRNYPVKSLTPIGTVRNTITEEILYDFPECLPKDYICQTDLSKYRTKYVKSSLSSEKGEVTNLESELIINLLF